jgi:hypothetical protein
MPPRIPLDSIDSVPAASRAILETLSPQPLGSGPLLNLHAAMAHAPAVLAAYAGFRDAVKRHGTLTPMVRSALMLTASSAERCTYTSAINMLLAVRAGWRDDQAIAIRTGHVDEIEARVAALLLVARDAARGAGRVRGATWSAALAAGWSDADLAEAFASIGLTQFVGAFARYARVPLDVPAALGPGR